MSISDHDLNLLASRIGEGDRAAFRHLYALLAPTTLAAVRTELPERGQAVSVVRATFCEVWWTCAFDRRRRSTHRNVPQWIAGIAERRGGDRRRTLDLINRTRTANGHAIAGDGMMADQDQLMDREFMTILDGQDTVL